MAYYRNAERAMQKTSAIDLGSTRILANGLLDCAFDAFGAFGLMQTVNANGWRVSMAERCSRKVLGVFG